MYAFFLWNDKEIESQKQLQFFPISYIIIRQEVSL